MGRLKSLFSRKPPKTYLEEMDERNEAYRQRLRSGGRGIQATTQIPQKGSKEAKAKGRKGQGE